MNKKLITLAVAAAMTAPAAVFAEATIYGVLHESIDYVDVDEYALWGAVPISGSGRANLLNAGRAYTSVSVAAFNQNTLITNAGVIPGSPGEKQLATISGPTAGDPTVVGIVPVSNANTYADNRDSCRIRTKPRR